VAELQDRVAAIRNGFQTVGDCAALLARGLTLFRGHW
jgi:hypothetical protein